MRCDLLLKGGVVVTPSGASVADIAVSEGKIVQIGDLAPWDAEQTLDVRHLTVFPGVIDTQVHFREPGMEHKEDLESGTRAAVCGGVTTILEMPNTLPPTTTAEALADKMRRAEGRAWCDYGFFIGGSHDNAQHLPTLERLPGVPGVKIFMGSSTGTLLVPDDAALEAILANGTSRCPVHAEDHARLESRKALEDGSGPAQHPFLRDAECARLATERLIRASRATGRAVHVLHVSTLDELPLIADAKRSGVPITAEVTPQHLFFTAPDCYELLGTKAQMNPPLRGFDHREALRAALIEGLFDVIGSDHAPHTVEEKAQPYPKSPSGMPGVQTLLPVMLTLNEQVFHFSLPHLAKLTAQRPAELYSMRDKGRIEVGCDADFAVVDTNATWVVEKPWLQSKCGWSPYEGMTLRGRPVHTVLRGSIVVRDSQLQGTPAGQPVRYDR